MGDLDIEGMSRIAVLAVDPTRRRAGGALLATSSGYDDPVRRATRHR